MQTLVAFKNYLADRPEFAFLALSLVAVFVLFRMYVKARDSHVETLRTIIPLTEKLCRLIGRINAIRDRWGIDD